LPLVPKFVPQVGVKLVNHFSAYNISDLPLVQQVLPLQRHGNEIVYAPPMHVDEVGITSDAYLPLNETVSFLPLSLSVGRLSLQRYPLMAILQANLEGQKEMGFSDSDIDDVRRLVADTSVWLLTVTVIASVLHLLFEFLAFRSDVSFWRNNKSMKGLSARAIVMELCFQCVIFLFLMDEGASLLVLVPSAIGLGIQVFSFLYYFYVF